MGAEMAAPKTSMVLPYFLCRMLQSLQLAKHSTLMVAGKFRRGSILIDNEELRIDNDAQKFNIA
jgi:hypothetical protein